MSTPLCVCYVYLNGSQLGLNYLNYLNLSKTKITDKGVASMVSNANFKDQLEVLLLDGCSRIKSSNTLVPIVNAFTQLVQLSLANTAIQKQDINTKLRKPVRLEQLDLSNTFITDEDIVQIVSQFHQLIDLKLGRCEELTTRGLSFLPRGTYNLIWGILLIWLFYRVTISKVYSIP